MRHHLLTLTIFLPLFGAIAQTIISKQTQARLVALGCSLLASFNAIVLLTQMRSQLPDLQVVEDIAWVGSFAIRYAVGLDGLNALPFLLCAIVFPLLIISEWRQKQGARGAYGLLLLLQTACFGMVCAQDLFLIFFFLTLTALPFYFLLAIWGGAEREKAAFRYFMVASIGHAFIFVFLVLIYHATNPHTFFVRDLIGSTFQKASFTIWDREVLVAPVAFLFLSIGLALRLPLCPFHGWFSSFCAQASSSTLVAMGGVFIPLALYIFSRLAYSLFPQQMADFAPVVITLAGLNIFFGTLSVVGSKELRSFFSFISVTQVGFILLGIGSLDAAGSVGAVYQGLCAGLGLSGFGLFAGLLQDRLGDSDFPVFQPSQGRGGASSSSSPWGGIARSSPVMALITAVIMISLVGFPGLGGFVGQSLIFMGSFSIHPMVLGLTGFGLVLMTFGLFSVYRIVFLGKPQNDSIVLPDLSLREKSALLPIVLVLLFLGLYPKPLLDLVRPSVLTLLSIVR